VQRQRCNLTALAACMRCHAPHHALPWAMLFHAPHHSCRRCRTPHHSTCHAMRIGAAMRHAMHAELCSALRVAMPACTCACMCVWLACCAHDVEAHACSSEHSVLLCRRTPVAASEVPLGRRACRGVRGVAGKEGVGEAPGREGPSWRGGCDDARCRRRCVPQFDCLLRRA